MGGFDDASPFMMKEAIERCRPAMARYMRVDRGRYADGPWLAAAIAVMPITFALSRLFRLLIAMIPSLTLPKTFCRRSLHA